VGGVVSGEALARWDRQSCTWVTKGESQTEGNGLTQERRSHAFLSVGKGPSFDMDALDGERCGISAL
jgi:hypothetical protein